MEHIVDHFGKCRGHARHLKTDIKSLFHSQLSLHIFDRFFFDIDGDSNVAHFFGELKAEWIHIRDNNVSCSSMTSDRGSHYADRSSACDQNILAKHLECKSRMNRVAEWIEYRGDLKIDIRLVL